MSVGYGDGTTEILPLFAAQLKSSRWVYVDLVENEQAESLVRALLASFDSF